jgi:hypothetical protein
MTTNPKTETEGNKDTKSEGTKRAEAQMNPTDDKAKEAARSKSENEMNRAKVKAEHGQAQWESPEHMRKDGQDVHLEQKVAPSGPNPADNPEYAGTRYSGDPKYKGK